MIDYSDASLLNCSEASKERLIKDGYLLFRTNKDTALEYLRRIGIAWKGELTPIIVKPIKKSKTVAQSSKRLEAHNECAYSREIPRFISLYCEKSQVEGGQFFIVEGNKVISLLGESFASAIKEAWFQCEHPRSGETFDTRLVRDISGISHLVYSAIGSLSGVESHFKLKPGQGKLASFLIKRLNYVLNSRENYRYHNWRAGDLVILDNYRFMHGRNGFEGEDRKLLHFRLSGVKV
jgi:alpha-ketoglutarate-dependent taurine dioxygenase